MTHDPVAPEAGSLAEVIAGYERQGYTVSAAEGVVPPTFDRDHRIDFVARRGSEVVYIEVKRATGFLWPNDFDRRDERLAVAVQQLSDARLDVVVVPDPSDALPTADNVRDRAAGAERLLDDAAPQSIELALLLGAAAVEGALRVLAYRSGVFLDFGNGLSSVAAALRSQGALGQPEWQILDSVGSTRDAVVHGLRPGREANEEVVRTTIRFAYALAAQVFLEADQLEQWFRSHYENPVHHVPVDTREGGYQYFNGGPYDARDVLEDEFRYVPTPIIEAALHELEGEATEWVRIGDY